jgi:hypothetical protein
MSSTHRLFTLARPLAPAGGPRRRAGNTAGGTASAGASPRGGSTPPRWRQLALESKKKIRPASCGGSGTIPTRPTTNDAHTRKRVSLHRRTKNTNSKANKNTAHNDGKAMNDKDIMHPSRIQEWARKKLQRITLPAFMYAAASRQEADKNLQQLHKKANYKKPDDNAPA